MGSSLLVALCRSLVRISMSFSSAQDQTYRVLGLVDLVTESVLGGGGTGGNVDVGVFGNVLVGLLGSARGGLLDLVTNVVGSVPEIVLICEAKSKCQPIETYLTDSIADECGCLKV